MSKLENLVNSGKKALSGIVLASALALSGAVQEGCVSPWIPKSDYERAKTALQEGKNYVGLLDGLVGYELQDERYALESPSYVTAINANNPGEHMKLIREAHSLGRTIDLVGFSMGGDGVFELAEKCQKQNIPIRAIHTIDFPSKKKIPCNVKYVFQYKGTVPYIFRCNSDYTFEDLKCPNDTLLGKKTLEGAGHMECPSQAVSTILHIRDEHLDTKKRN